MRHGQTRSRDNANSQGRDKTPHPHQGCHVSKCEINVQQGLHNDQEVFLFWMTFTMRAR